MNAVSLEGWGELLLALGLFMATHAVPARPTPRRVVVAALGERLYLTLYGVVSILLLVWLFAAMSRAPFVPLWAYAPWQTLAPNLAMPLACVVVALAVGAPNPLSFGGGHPERFDPDAPGAAGLCRHPIPLAMGLWSATHVLPNGDAAHVLVFGTFAAFSILGMKLVDRRRQRQMGFAEWQRLATRTTLVPGGNILSGRWHPRPDRGDARRCAIGLAVYVLLLALHPSVIGVSPLPTW